MPLRNQKKIVWLSNAINYQLTLNPSGLLSSSLSSLLLCCSPLLSLLISPSPVAAFFSRFSLCRCSLSFLGPSSSESVSSEFLLDFFSDLKSHNLKINNECVRWFVLQGAPAPAPRQEMTGFVVLLSSVGCLTVPHPCICNRGKVERGVVVGAPCLSY